MLLIRNKTRGLLLAYKAGIANTSSLRRRGLLKHEHLSPGDGLWLVPCEAVHTFGMKFPIDVLYLSRAKKVLKIESCLPKRRISLYLRAHFVLELPAGMAAATGTAVGDELTMERVEPA